MSTILANEPEKFGAIAQSWWDPQGPFKPLHRLNPVRLSYIRHQVTTLKTLNVSKEEIMAQPFSGLSILDIAAKILEEVQPRVLLRVMATKYVV